MKVRPYKIVANGITYSYVRFADATNKLVELGKGKLFYGRVLVGEL